MISWCQTTCLPVLAQPILAEETRHPWRRERGREKEEGTRGASVPGCPVLLSASLSGTWEESPPNPAALQPMRPLENPHGAPRVIQGTAANRHVAKIPTPLTVSMRPTYIPENHSDAVPSANAATRICQSCSSPFSLPKSPTRSGASHPRTETTPPHPPNPSTLSLHRAT